MEKKEREQKDLESGIQTKGARESETYKKTQGDKHKANEKETGSKI